VPAGLSGEIQEFALGGVVVVIGTRDSACVGEIARAWGVRVMPGGEAIELCVFAQANRRTLDNLADNHRIAVTLMSPSTYRSVQLKGRAVVTTASHRDLQRVEAHFDAFLQELASAGLSNPLMRRLVDSERETPPELAKIRIEIEQIFDQTPGPTAGARL